MALYSRIWLAKALEPTGAMELVDAGTPCWLWPTCTCVRTRTAADSGDAVASIASISPSLPITRQGHRRTRRAREIAPFMSYRKFTGDAPLGTCAFWRCHPGSAPCVWRPASADGGGIHRMTRRPYKAEIDLANQLRGSLLTFDGTQHAVVFQGDSCIDEVRDGVFNRRLPLAAPSASRAKKRRCDHFAPSQVFAGETMAAVWRHQTVELGAAVRVAARRTASSAPLAGATEEPGAGQTLSAPVVAPQQVGTAAASSSPTPAKFALHAARRCPSPSTTTNPVGPWQLADDPSPTGQRFELCWSIWGTRGVGGRHGRRWHHDRHRHSPPLRPGELRPEGSAATHTLRCHCDAEVRRGHRRDPMADYESGGVTTSNRSTGPVGPGLC